MDKIIMPVIIVGGPIALTFGKLAFNYIKEKFSTFKFKDEDINIIYKYFE